MHKNGGNSHSYFFLGFVARARDNFISSLLSSNSLYRKVGETVPTLYPRNFISLSISMIEIVLCSSLLSSIHLPLVEMRDIYVWSRNFHINRHHKYDTKNTERERDVSELSVTSSGNQSPLNSASAHTVKLLPHGWMYMPIFSVPFKYLNILLTSSPYYFIWSLVNLMHWCTAYAMSGQVLFSE